MIKERPRRYFTNTGERCDRIQVAFTIDKNFLVMTVAYLLGYNGELPKEKITKKSVEQALRVNLKYEGEDWVEKLSYEIEDKSNRYKVAYGIAKELFPFWFINKSENALNFIMKGD